MSENGGNISKISVRSSHTEDGCEHNASGLIDFGQLKHKFGCRRGVGITTRKFCASSKLFLN